MAESQEQGTETAGRLAEQPRSRIRLDSDEDRAVVIRLRSTEKYIVVTLDNAKIHVFNHDGTGHKVLAAHVTAVWAADVWDEMLLSGDRDGDVRVWDLESGEHVRKLTGHTATVRALRISDPDTAISGSRDQTLRIWDIPTGTCKHVLEGHTSTIRCMEVSGDLIVSGSNDFTARVWSISQGRCLHVLQSHDGVVYAVAFDGRRIVTGDAKGNVQVWDPDTAVCLANLQTGSTLVTYLHLHDGMLIAATAAGTISAWSMSGPEIPGRPIYEVSGHTSGITSLQVRDEKIVSGSSDGSVKVWNSQDGAAIGQIGQVADAAWKAAFDDDKTVVLVSRDRECLMEIWDSPLSAAA